MGKINKDSIEYLKLLDDQHADSPSINKESIDILKKRLESIRKSDSIADKDIEL